MTRSDTGDAVKVTKRGAAGSEYELIEPPNKLKEKAPMMTPVMAARFGDPIRRAEQEVKKLEPMFKDWMDGDLQRLRAAWLTLAEQGEGSLNHDVGAEDVAPLFRAAHDIKGQASTLGHPFAASVAASLCILLEQKSTLPKVPCDLIEKHVDAIFAIVRETGTDHGETIAFHLTEELQSAAVHFLNMQDG